MSWIRFVLESRGKGRKTDNWSVIANYSDELLGAVKWRSGWRCYTFYPRQGTLFESLCLMDLARFCADQTRAHKDAAPKGR